MACQNCNSERLLNLSAKCSDCFAMRLGDREHDGYVPRTLNIGGGDYVELSLCLDCGRVQGDFPVPTVDVDEAFDIE